jgi:predicted O-methyltransferase YrrM
VSRLDEAVALARERQFDQAIEILNREAEQPGERLAALGHRAWLLRVTGRYEESLRDYDEIISRAPDDAEARRLHAGVRLLMGDARGALDEAIEILNSDPLDREAGDIVSRAHTAISDEPVPPKQHDLTKIEPARALNPVLDQLERDPRNYPATVFPEIGRMLYTFVRMIRPKVVVEAGSYVGYSTISIAQALEDNGGGHIHAFDTFWPIENYVSPVIGPATDLLQIARAHVQAAGLSHRVTFHKGDSAESIAKAFEHKPASVDLAFIDGDHRLRGCLRDWNVVDEVLAPGGYVLLHDIYPDKCGWLGPAYLLKELSRKAGVHYQSLHIPSPEGLGVALIQKFDDTMKKEWRAGIWDLITEHYWEQSMGRKPLPLLRTVAQWFGDKPRPVRRDVR